MTESLHASCIYGQIRPIRRIIEITYSWVKTEKVPTCGVLHDRTFWCPKRRCISRRKTARHAWTIQWQPQPVRGPVSDIDVTWKYYVPFCAHHLHLHICQGTKLVKCTDLSVMWKYRKKQQKKVRYWSEVACCIQISKMCVCILNIPHADSTHTSFVMV